MAVPSARAGHWRLWATAAAVLLAATGAFAWYFAGPLDVTVTPVRRGPAIDAIYATGSVEPTVMLPLAPQVGGKLAARLVDEGALVRKGQLLARLDDSDLAGSVDEQRARADFARSQYARAKALAERGFVAAGEAQRAQSDLVAAEAALRRVRALRDHTSVFAPADGAIIRRDGEVGQYIAPGQALFVLACCAPLRVTAEIDEEDISRVSVGQAVLLRADALPGQVFDGKVSEITPKGDPVARSYRVRIALPAPGGLRTGMTVDANLLVARHDNAMLLPAAAARDNAVWIVSGHRLERRAITPGIRGPQQLEVLRGLDGSESVVTPNDPALKAGRWVRPHTP
ncbi:efflux RND transporter periplasmic adaptor subunit [Pseudoduganella eburnea]|uniref:Efflux RND transporter periplasmic adaptor subunit n=1 Tax=Massilia eburnea TaxID=1776165 RepID=A0A6L6QED7_9BURK|nr:efflux RND transporter periplasmic adaptor subunit [Massilia eburnea]MTW10016.1 efflux RND transporter periplasmic adaptor subunit [Massilia eburnea]